LQLLCSLWIERVNIAAGCKALLTKHSRKIRARDDIEAPTCAECVDELRIRALHDLLKNIELPIRRRLREHGSCHGNIAHGDTRLA